MLRTACSLAVLSLLSVPAVASAASVCIAKPDTPFAPATVVGGPAEPVGFLAHRQCFGVLETHDGRTRIFVSAPGFAGEVEVSDDDLLWVLAEDIPMRLKEGEEPFGLALAGTGVAIEESYDGGWVVRTVDGRAQTRFRVSEGSMLPAQVWPTLDADEVDPGGKWPKGDHALPPVAVVLGGKSGNRATIGAPLFELSEVLADPGLGALRYSVLDAEEGVVKVISPTWWVKGKVSDLDWRRQTLVDEETEEQREDWEGWDDLAGYRLPGPPAPLPREVATREAPLSLERKGERFAVLKPGARVSIEGEEKPWYRVKHTWDGGSVVGWLDKKRLMKEGKEITKPAVVIPRATAVTVGEVAVAWVEPGPEQATGKDGEPKVDKEGNPVVDPNETHEAPPEYAAPWLRLALRERIARLRHLYGRALATNGDAKGVITVRGEVDEEGAITWELVDSTFEDDAVVALIEEALETVDGPERKLRKSRRDKKDYRIELKSTVTFAPFSG